MRASGWSEDCVARAPSGEVQTLSGGKRSGICGATGAAAGPEAGNTRSRSGRIETATLLVGLVALLGTELVLILTIPGINYAGADGKAAQAIILATLEFAKPFHISNLNPLEGLGSQMMPMNIWANPAYWPFALFDKQTAADLSGLVAFVCYALAVYAMARCFDLSPVPGIAAAQIALLLFGPAALALGYAVVYLSIPGLAVVYAPHLLAFGLLARLSPQRPQVFLIGGAIFALLLYSLYCDPLWTMVSGIAWLVPFAVVAFCGPSDHRLFSARAGGAAPSGGLQRGSASVSTYFLPLVGVGSGGGVAQCEQLSLRATHDPHPQPLLTRGRGAGRAWGMLWSNHRSSTSATILVRCAVLGACVVLLLVGGALEYAYSLSQYTARVQFPDVLRRAPDAIYASAVVSSKYARYFYYACAPGWALGMALLRGRPRTVVLAAIASGLALAAYAAAFLFLGGNWPLPLPFYIEHASFPLFWTAAVAGYWAGVQALLAPVIPPPARGRSATPDLIGGIRVAVKSRQTPTRPHLPPREAGTNAGDLPLLGGGIERRLPWLRQLAAGMALMGGLAAVCIVPALTFGRVLKYPPATMRYWQEPWLNQPELHDFLRQSIGLRVGRRFRGSALFYTNQYDEFLTIDSLWAAGVPTLNEYSQLVSPQSIYFIHELLGRDLATELNWFRPWIGNGDFPLLFKTLRALGVRYVIGYGRLPVAEAAQIPSIALPRRPRDTEPGEWLAYELGDVNDGSYSPVSVTVARSAAETVTRLRAPDFDFSKQVALSAPVDDSLVSARDARLSLVRGGWHVSAQSDGTSLLLLPQQFSHCLRAHDARVRLVRADLIMTGLIFSASVDTDLSFDYGVLSPTCRRADLADIKQLQIRLTSP